MQTVKKEEEDLSRRGLPEMLTARATAGAERDDASTFTVYTWTRKEGLALLRAIRAQQKHDWEYKRRWRAQRRRDGKPT